MLGWQTSALDVGGGCRDMSARTAWRHSEPSRSPSPRSVQPPLDMIAPLGAQVGGMPRVAKWPLAPATARKLPVPPIGSLLGVAAGMPAPMRSRSASPLTATIPAMPRSRSPSPQPQLQAGVSQVAVNHILMSKAGAAHIGTLPLPEPIGEEGNPRTAPWLAQPVGAEGRLWKLPPAPSLLTVGAGVTSGGTNGTQAVLSSSISGVALRSSAPPTLWCKALPPVTVGTNNSAKSVVAAGEFAVQQLRKEVSDLRAELRQVRAALSDGHNTPSPSIEFEQADTFPIDQRGSCEGSECSQMTLGATFGLVGGSLNSSTATLCKQLSPILSRDNGREKELGNTSSCAKTQNGESGVVKPLLPTGVYTQSLHDQDHDLSFACDLRIAASAPSHSHDENYNNEWGDVLGGEGKRRNCRSLADTLRGHQSGCLLAQHVVGLGLDSKPDLRRTVHNAIQEEEEEQGEVVQLEEAALANMNEKAASNLEEAVLAQTSAPDGFLPSPPRGDVYGEAHPPQKWPGAENVWWADGSMDVSDLQHSVDGPVDSLGCTFQRNSGYGTPTSGGASGDELMDAALTSCSVAEEGCHGPHSLATDGRSHAVEQRSFGTRPRTANTPGSTSCASDLLSPHSKDGSGSCILVSPSRLEVSYVMSHRDEEDTPSLDKDLAWTKALPMPPPTFSIPARKKPDDSVVRNIPKQISQQYLPPPPAETTDESLGHTILLTSGTTLFPNDTPQLSTSVLIGMTSPPSVDVSLSLAASQTSTILTPGASTLALAKSFESVDLSSSRCGLVKDSARSPRSAVSTDTSIAGMSLPRRYYTTASSFGGFQSGSSHAPPGSSIHNTAPLPVFPQTGRGSFSASVGSSLEPKYFAAPLPRESFSVPVPPTELPSTPIRQTMGSISASSFPSAPLTPALSRSTSRTATPPSRAITPSRQPPAVAAPLNVLPLSSMVQRSSSPSRAAIQTSRMTSATILATSSAPCTSDMNSYSIGRTRPVTPQRTNISRSGSQRREPTTVSRRTLPSRDILPTRTSS